MGAGDASPVEALSFAFSSLSVNVVNPQPVWFRSSISVVPRTPPIVSEITIQVGSAVAFGFTVTIITLRLLLMQMVLLRGVCTVRNRPSRSPAGRSADFVDDTTPRNRDALSGQIQRSNLDFMLSVDGNEQQQSHPERWSKTRTDLSTLA
jgi:hypothetical protein